jgi:DNA-directed RNA polymerase subunit E'/Rpb7
MTSCYFDTELTVDVKASATQFNNNVINSIRQNLIEKYKNKCFKNYGYITAIHSFELLSDLGYMRIEDPTSSALFKVKFKCTLCNPIIGNYIISKVIGINQKMVALSEGPIQIFVDKKYINENNIKYHKTAFYPVSKDGNLINNPLKVGSYVKLKVLSKKIIKNTDRINAFGSIDNVATNNEVKEYMESVYRDKEFIEHDELINSSIVTGELKKDENGKDDKEDNKEDDKDIKLSEENGKMKYVDDSDDSDSDLESIDSD